MLVLKLIAGSFVAVVGYHAFRLRSLGRKLAFANGSRDFLLDSKRASWYCMTANILLAVGMIEMLVTVAPHGRHYPVFFPVHLVAAVGFVLLVLLLRWQTGARSRQFHRRAGYTALALLLVAVSTGGVLLVQL
jgi:hypothetical protein